MHVVRSMLKRSFKERQGRWSVWHLRGAPWVTVRSDTEESWRRAGGDWSVECQAEACGPGPEESLKMGQKGAGMIQTVLYGGHKVN